MRIQVTLDLTEEQLKIIADKMRAEGFDPARVQEGPGAGLIENFVKQLVDDAVDKAAA
jgi:hypothetical protein